MSTCEVDTALELYRDPDLLRAVMTFAKVPEVCPRVAVSLDDPLTGPFIVVTRDGHFVTCLGRGMQASALPVVTRARLDAYAARVESVRERLALGRYLKGSQERPGVRMIRNILERADRLSREEFLAISVWEPILHTLLVDLYIEANREVLALTPSLCDMRHFKGKRSEEVLHGYWKIVHAAGHLILLATTSGDSEYIRTLTADQPILRSALAWSLTQTTIAPFIVRGAWGVGRLGKGLLPAYKRALGEEVAFLKFLDSIFGLIAIGRRNSASRAEIIKALHSAPATARNPHAEQLRQSMRREIELVCNLAAQAINCESEELESWLVTAGKALMGAGDKSLPPELLLDVARVLPLHSYADGLSDGGKLFDSVLLVAATARNAPEQFYLPHALVNNWHPKWEPKHTLALLEPRRRQQRLSRTPARRENVPERNQPCLCGSGKKYKRCCCAA